MLILTRRPAETIYIGEEVRLTVLGVVGNQVRFGIEAPRSVTIDRAEIYERKKRAQQGRGKVEPTAPADGNVAPSAAAAPPVEKNGNVVDPEADAA